MIQSHEHRVDNNAKRDKQFNKRVKHQPGNPFLQFQPAPTTIPDAENVDALERQLDQLLFHRGPIFVVFFFCGEIVHRHCNVKRRRTKNWQISTGSSQLFTTLREKFFLGWNFAEIFLKLLILGKRFESNLISLVFIQFFNCFRHRL